MIDSQFWIYRMVGLDALSHILPRTRGTNRGVMTAGRSAASLGAEACRALVPCTFGWKALDRTFVRWSARDIWSDIVHAPRQRAAPSSTFRHRRVGSLSAAEIKERRINDRPHPLHRRHPDEVLVCIGAALTTLARPLHRLSAGLLSPACLHMLKQSQVLTGAVP